MNAVVFILTQTESLRYVTVDIRSVVRIPAIFEADKCCFSGSENCAIVLCMTVLVSRGLLKASTRCQTGDSFKRAHAYTERDINKGTRFSNMQEVLYATQVENFTCQIL